ncbi:hypothetical protein IB276_17755 [Ensifer sp. ENS04]|uniref:hypothetical protein n=1 Tax=Ensifer sp. ENS04 TaxID=2769281 RepID=UPI0017819F37|nr:hypothetical protein [Ensifer sp. ENS04]MBD9541304.1 hypothetical protein [Ensifer sp. ENS04]
MRGIVGIHARLEPGAFLIPYFVSKTSNYTFAQELGADRRVKAFKPIEVDRFSFIEVVTQTTELHVGDPGMIAFADREGTPVVGFAQELQVTWKVSDFGSNVSAFRRIDICYFLQDFKGLEAAINDAARTLHPQVRRSWTRMERTAAARARIAGVHAVGAAGGQDSFNGEGGIDRWLEAWKKFGPTDRLLVEGFKLAFETDGNVGNRARIASSVVFAMRARSISTRVRDEITSKLRAWLAGPAVVGDRSVWSKAWLAALKQDLIAYGTIRLGMDYLKATQSDRHLGANWNRIWKAMWLHSDGWHDELTDVAADALDRYGATSTGRRLITLLSEMVDDHSISFIVRQWMTGNQQSNSHWGTAFLALIRAESTEARSLVDVGLQWLRSEEGKLKIWADVYEEVSRYQEESVMLPIARDWVLRSNMEMRIWPKIAAKVLRSSVDNRLRERVRQWTEAHPSSEESWELQLLLDDDDPQMGADVRSLP